MGAANQVAVVSPKAMLGIIVQHTFETLFFVEAVPVDEADAARIDGTDGLEVAIAIRCAYSGRIVMSLSRESACRLAGPALTSAGELSDDVLADLYAETLNTIGGRLAAALAQESEAFDLSIPTVAFGKVGPAGGAPDTIRRCFRIEHGWVRFAFLIDPFTPDSEVPRDR